MSTIESSLSPKLFIFPGRISSSASDEIQSIYNQTYITWKETWEHVFNVEMNKDFVLHSDDFVRQDYIVSLLCRDYIAGTAFIRLADPSFAPTFDDSAFRLWGPHALEVIKKMDSNFAVASYFTIHPEFRRGSFNICWKTLFLSLYLRFFHSLELNIMLTATRKLKSNDKLCAKFGSHTLASDLPYTLSGKKVGQESVDLIYWHKDSPLIIEDKLNPLHNNIWNERIVSV